MNDEQANSHAIKLFPICLSLSLVAMFYSKRNRYQNYDLSIGFSVKKIYLILGIQLITPIHQDKFNLWAANNLGKDK